MKRCDAIITLKSFVLSDLLSQTLCVFSHLSFISQYNDSYKSHREVFGNLTNNKKKILCCLIKKHLIYSVMAISALFSSLYSCWFAVIFFFAHFHFDWNFRFIWSSKNDNVSLYLGGFFYIYFVRSNENDCNFPSPPQLPFPHAAIAEHGYYSYSTLCASLLLFNHIYLLSETFQGTRCVSIFTPDACSVNKCVISGIR